MNNVGQELNKDGTKNKKMKGVENLILKDKNIEQPNVNLCEDDNESIDFLNNNFNLHQVNNEMQGNKDDNDNEGQGVARKSADSRESTVKRARAFLAQHWGNELANREFPNSSEDEEYVTVDWIDDMFFRDSRDSNSLAGAELEDRSEINSNEVNMATKNWDEKAEPTDDYEWWLGDTGASCHVTNDELRITKLVETANDKVIVGDKRKCSVTKKDNLVTTTNDGNCLELNGLRVVPDIGKNIVSIGILLDEGGKVHGDEKQLIVENQGSILTFRRNTRDGLYYIQLKRVLACYDDECYNVDLDRDWNMIGKNNKIVDKSKWKEVNRTLAHQQWGHHHENQLNKMANHLKVKLVGKLTECAGCALTKSRANATIKTSVLKATKKGQRLFIDTIGPYPASRGGMKYWACAVDDFTDMTWTNFTRSKSKMTEFVSSLVTEINGKGLKVEYIRCDNAGEHMKSL